MYNMFEEIKRYLKPTQVVKFYLGEGKYRNGSYWYVSPFRNEKTASFCVNDKKGIHDFGDSRHYDIVSFSSRLFGLSNTDSIKKLIYEFNLPLKFGQKKPQIFYERDLKKFKDELVKKEFEKQQKQNYYEDLYEFSCENFKKWNNFIFDLQKQRKVLNSMDLCKIYTMRDYYESIVDILFNSDYEEVWKNKERWESVLLSEDLAEYPYFYTSGG